RNFGNVTLQTATAVERLVRDGDKVVGVELQRGGRRQAIHAGAVILASGGFARSEDLVSIFCPAWNRAIKYGGFGNTGDGLRMAMHAGAGLSDMGYVVGTFGTHPDQEK